MCVVSVGVLFLALPFQEVNMTGSLMMITPERYEDLDVSEYLYMDDYTAAYERPQFESYVDGFLKPFPLMVRFLKCHFCFLFTTKHMYTLYILHRLRLEIKD